MSIPLLTVGVLTINGRENFLERLQKQFKSIVPQEYSLKIEFIYNKDNKQQSVGNKRNEILKSANGKYICFVDDDDLVSDDYFIKIIPELEKDVDCVGFYGAYYVNNKFIMHFNHANKNGGHYKNNNIQYRPINHLNPVKTLIAKQIKFTDKNMGEDSDYSDVLFNSQLIKSESNIDSVLYHYFFDERTTEAQRFENTTEGQKK